MINQDYDKVKECWRQWWNKENADRPLVSVFGRKKNAKPFVDTHKGTLKEKWEDMEYVLKRELYSFENTYYGGEAYPVVNPNLGPDIYGAILGDCNIEYGDVTSWAIHNVESFEEAAEYRFDEHNRWMQKVMSMTKYAMAEADERYLVGVTDLHSGMDALTSLRGPAELCMDLYDCRDVIKKKLDESRLVYDRVLQELFAVTEAKQEGYTNWMRIWHPDKKWFVTCCDFACLISQDDFGELIEPTIRHELDVLQASVYHLDGPGALKHLDTLCNMEKLNGIQWVPGAGQPTARAWKDVLQKIQQAGKNIQIDIVPDDIEELASFLRPEGVHFVYYAADDEEAQAVVKRVEKAYAHR